MSKKLEILIPHYHETAEEIKPLLDSIALQQQIDTNDIGVIICHDGTEPNVNSSVNCGDYYPKENESKAFDFYDDRGIGGNYSIFEDYPFEIKQIRQEHKGVSAARNSCLDAATADYVMFCDADDMFFNMCGLYIIFREMKGDGFNALSSVFVEETKDAATNEKVYINREMDSTFVHGKVYRRSFLVSNNIRWNDSLTIHEDSYFNCLAQKMTAEVKYCQQPFYLWKWRDNSVCRHDPKYILKTYNNMLDSNTALVKELLKRRKKIDAQFYACSMIYDAYYMMNKKEWLDQENQDYRHCTELRFKQYYNEFKELFDSVAEELKTQLIIGMKNRFFQEGVFFEAITFDDWIRHIEQLN